MKRGNGQCPVQIRLSNHVTYLRTWKVEYKEVGTYKVTHAGQFINTEQGHFPNFDFIRALQSSFGCKRVYD